MAEIGASAIATKCTDILVDKVMKELPYLCCYESYADDFEQKKRQLSAAVKRMDIKIKEAKTRNETQIDPVVKHWVQRAEKLSQQEPSPKKWFGCFSQCSLAKELERMTREIPIIMEKVENFSQVAYSAERPGMEFYSQEFMHFKSRDSIFEQLREELKDGNKCRIGLQAMGGSGKTTMAKAVGKEVENSKAFDKVIFIEVPNPVDEKKIRDEIAKKLDMQLEDEKKFTHAEQIWIRIANAGNLLIILDDVWKELNLENIGIHHGIHTQGRCCILLTTRYDNICRSMKCQKTIKLGVLPEEDAVDLFLSHASESGNDCRDRLKVAASKIVNKCGMLPIIVVAVAKTLRNQDPREWEEAFAATEKDASLRHGNADEEAKKFYNSLRLSFKHLAAGAQDLFQICSIFPRAYEIPIELLSKIAIGSGLCGNDDSYYIARSQVLSIKTTLVGSALLLTAREGCVKMHDVIRDVAQQIAHEKVQEIMDPETKLRENVKYSSWIIKDFSNYLKGSNLEVLLVWVNANGSLEVRDAFFDGIKGLRVLLLYSKIKYGRTLASSLPKSIQSLENIQTLCLTNWKLGDISILQNLKKLQALELTNCSIIELPTDVSQLEKLRLLGLVRCLVERNNPFEVIERCSKLEVLYYLSNDVNLNINAKPSKITVLQEFGIYHIEGRSSWCSFQLDGSIKRYFNPTKLKGILSESTIKSLAARAEILELTECDETRWTNLIPDMVQIKEGGMNDLIRLCLRSWPAIQCLIYTNGIRSNAIIFSNLVELRLKEMHMRELCHGDYPNSFLKQLEKLDLSRCVELEGTLFKSKLELGNLKSIEIDDCSMTCLFHPSTAQSLKQLKNVYISGCSKLECLISDERSAELQKEDDHQDPNQENQDPMLPKLKFLKIQNCQGLEVILPICSHKDLPLLESMKIHGCNELKYIFGQCLEEGGLNQVEKEIMLPLLKEIEIANVPKFINIYQDYDPLQPSQVKKSWGPICCFWSKSSASSVDAKATQLDHTQVLKEKHVVNRAHGLFTPPLYPYKFLKIIKIEGFSELKALFILSAASSLKLLEKLQVIRCGALEQIVIDERHGHDRTNDSSIFPNLQRIEVTKAEELKYVFGKCHFGQQHNVHMDLNLLALKELYLDDVPNMVSICSENYYVEALSLQDIRLEKCPQLPLKTVIDLSVDVRKGQDLLRRKAPKSKSIPSTTHEYFTPISYQCNLREIEIMGFPNLTSLFTLSIASSLKLLEELEVTECDALEHIVTFQGHGHDHLNVGSIFPKLRCVDVRSCNHLEYIFPAFYSKDFKDLESVDIRKAQRLKYVFGKCHVDQNHSDKIELNLPALKDLCLRDVPNMLHICTENYHVKALYVEDISLGECPQLLIQTFKDFLEGGHKRQDFSRKKALSLKQKSKPLPDLQEVPDFRDISEGSKNYQSFRNLSTLKLKGCRQLKFLLSTSISRNMPKLSSLIISNCEELVSIIEDEENGTRRECFPELRRIKVKHCKKLKCLFSISKCGKLPQLMFLNIEDAPDLGQVFGWEQGTPQEPVMKDVLPKLFALRLINLPTLHTICQGIDFQSVKVRLVHHCPNIALTSANASSRELFDVHRTLRNDLTNFVDEDYYSYTSEILNWAFKREEEEESKEAPERDKTTSEQSNSSLELANSEEASKEIAENDSTVHKQNSSLSNSTEIEEKGPQEAIRKDSTMPNQNNGSPNLANSEEMSRDIPEKDSETDKQTGKLPNLTKNTEASTNNEIVEQLSSSNTTTLSSSSDLSEETPKEIIEKDFTTQKQSSKLPHMKEESCAEESMDDKEALEEGISPNGAPQRVIAKATKECCSKETPRKAAFTIPPPTSKMTFPLIPSISTPEKPQVVTSSATYKEPKSSQSNQSVTSEFPEDEIMVNDEKTLTDEEIKIDQKQPQQCEEHDLMMLFKIMKESADTEVDMSYVSKIIADLKDNNEASKALTDLEASLKMSLNEIATSEGNRLRLENSLSILSSHCFEDGPPSYGLQATIHSLQQEIRYVLSSFNLAYATIESFNELEQKEKHMIEQRSLREEAAKTLLSDINKAKNSIAEAKNSMVKGQLKEAELKEQISKLRAELHDKEKEIEECERKLLSLQEQEKKSVYDTIGFIMEFEALKKEKSHMVVEDQINARQQLEDIDTKWSSCLSNLKKATMLLGVHLKQKI
ncbi:uncharacterized protein LOC129285702 isoform X3 [Prosopis cineraria]|uniref:uncharacterized protein LOC129285702 isoform X3 n=1 Tax=Prosopis cineraria TaxID=364024 RepID=UPI00240EAA53|nr:uncharacterized protein LOC129285702 isoform X3 [Prosopis cineraria]